MNVTVRINQIDCYGYHGTHPAERELGQRFIIDLKMIYDAKQVIETDNIRYAVNYVDVYNKVTRIVEESQCQLIEALCALIGQEILNSFPIQEIQVTVEKPKIPVKANLKSVSATLTLKKG